MSLTPAVLIAAAGLAQGQGLVVNSSMTSLISTISSSTLASTGNQLLILPSTIPGLPTVLAKIPTYVTNSVAVGSAVLAQANAQLASAGTQQGVKSWISLFTAAGAFAAQSQQFSAAVTALSGSNFTDFGLGFSGFQDVISNGATALFPAGTAVTVMQSTVRDLSASLARYGSAWDSVSVGQIGSPSALLASLVTHGVTARSGVDAALAAQGYTSRDTVPNNILISVFRGVSGPELGSIGLVFSSQPLTPLENLADYLSLEKFMSTSTQSLLGLLANSEMSLSQLANKLANLGIRTVSQLETWLDSVVIVATPGISSLSSPLPANIAAELAVSLGTGQGSLGNPLISDILGTAAGIPHVANFSNVFNQLSAITATTAGQAVIQAGGSLIANVSISANLVTDPNVALGVSGLAAAVTALNSTISSRSDLAAGNVIASASLSASLAHLTTESLNIALAGRSFSANGIAANTGTAVTDSLSWANKLSDYGADAQKLGYSAVLLGVASSDITGSAVAAAVIEGMNLAASRSAGKPTPAVVNPAVVIAASNSTG